jgi:hypothetical protein
MTKKKIVAGAPKKNPDVRKRPDGLREEQHIWLAQEAVAQGVSKAQLKEQIIDWYIAAIERQRGDSSVHELFDKIVEENHKNKK